MFDCCTIDFVVSWLEMFVIKSKWNWYRCNVLMSFMISWCFVDSQVVAPVRETCAQTIGVIARCLMVEGVRGMVGVVLQLLGQQQWEVRHGGLLSLKYVLAVRQVSWSVIISLDQFMEWGTGNEIKLLLVGKRKWWKVSQVNSYIWADRWSDCLYWGCPLECIARGHRWGRRGEFMHDVSKFVLESICFRNSELASWLCKNKEPKKLIETRFD